jgi:polyphosphate kinase
MKLQNITDREMSWLSFNQRVLELAEDPTMRPGLSISNFSKLLP